MKAKKNITGNLLIIILFWFLGSHQAVQAQYVTDEQIKEIKKKAAAGDLSAQHDLSMLYRMEEFGMQDMEKGMELLRKVADKGHAAAQSDLSKRYLEKENYKAAFKYAKLAADQGYDSHESDLADFYFDGLGVQKDLDKAAYWYKRAEDADALLKVDIMKYSVDDYRWTFFAKSQSGNRYYYLPQSVLQVGNVFKVLMKEVPESLKTRSSNYWRTETATYDLEVSGFTISCSDNWYSEEEVRSYYNSEEINDYSEGGTHDFEPGTIMTALKEEICY